MKSSLILLTMLLVFVFNSCSQNMGPSNLIGGGCEGCEVVNQCPVPFSKLNWTDTLPDYHETGPKIVISGTIYQADAKTPAKDIVMYMYHTDQTGHYTNRNNESGMAGRHGYIKGWLKTNATGQYKFYTLKPVAYPNRKAPAHIHPVIKEPGINEYYIDEFVFDEDPLLTASEKGKLEQRGGSGIVHLQFKNGLYEASRDIVLGLNIPNYPSKKN